MGWVVAVEDLAIVERRLGRAGVDGNRHRPDGRLERQIGCECRYERRNQNEPTHQELFHATPPV